jgi:hypothetical protein
MPKLDPGRLIREAQELMVASNVICERSRRAVCGRFHRQQKVERAPLSGYWKLNI